MTKKSIEESPIIDFPPVNKIVVVEKEAPTIEQEVENIEDEYEEKKVINYDREVEIEWKKYSIYKPLPTSFLKSKLSEKSTYLPVPVYRTIIRQINNDSIERYWFEEFSLPKFSEKPIELYEWKTEKWGNVKSIKSMYCDCFVPRKNPVTNTQQLLHWVWYSAMSIDMLLTDSSLHGNMHTLRAKALRDAMKYSYAIFEFPEDDYDQEEPNVKAQLKEKSVISDVVKSIVSEKKEEEKIESNKTATIPAVPEVQEESKINIEVLDLRIQWVKDKVSNLKEFSQIATTIKQETMETFWVTEAEAKSALQPLLSKYREIRNIK